MEELDDGSQANGARAAVASVARRQEKQGGTQPFSPTSEKITGDLGNGIKGGTSLSRQFLFYRNEVVFDEIENLPGCEQRDSRPPGLR